MGKSAEGESGCDWFEWAEMDENGENIHLLRNKKRREQDDSINPPQNEAATVVQTAQDDGTIRFQS